MSFKKLARKRNLTMSIQYRFIIILQQNHPVVNLTGEEHKSGRKKMTFEMQNHLWETWKPNKTNNKISWYH